MMDIQSILSRLKKVSQHGKGWKACCPAHDDKTPSLSISIGKEGVLFNCFAGCSFGDIADAMGLKPVDLFYEKPGMDYSALKAKVAKPIPVGAPKLVGEWTYTDEFGQERYSVERWEPGLSGGRKSFRQKHRVNGEWVYSMDGVHRILYNAKLIYEMDTVWIVEGEAKADALVRMGIPATCCVGGAKSWMDAYADQLTGKHVIVNPDSDAPGAEFAQRVQDSLAGKVASLRIVHNDDGYNDVLDWLAASDEVTVGDALTKKSERVTVLNRGYNIPVYSMQDMEDRYIKFLNRSEGKALDLGRWIPSLKHFTRPLVPGEVVTFLAETGVGKTMLLQNIALHCNLKCLMFEMELPDTLTFERYTGMVTNQPGADVERIYRGGKRGLWRESKQAGNVFCCPVSRLTPDALRKIIQQSELIVGEPPGLVLVDYIQLMRGTGDRRERVAHCAEEMKVIAKECDTIIVLASQVHRKGEDAGGRVYLNDGKEAGEIENSSGLVIGAHRDATDSNILLVYTLKQTKGKPMREGQEIKCKIFGSLRIEEMYEHATTPAKTSEPVHGSRTVAQITGETAD